MFFNDSHGDYLIVKDSEAMLLDYLATLVAKEYVVYNNPRASPDEVGEELVRMLVRVRRHIPRRRLRLKPSPVARNDEDAVRGIVFPPPFPPRLSALTDLYYIVPYYGDLFPLAAVEPPGPLWSPLPPPP